MNALKTQEGIENKKLILRNVVSILRMYSISNINLFSIPP